MRARRDRRVWLLAATAALVAGGGLLLHYLPGRGVEAGAPAAPQTTSGDVAQPVPIATRATATSTTERAHIVDELFKQGVAMLHIKRYVLAATAFHRLLQIEPRLPEANVNMGFALMGQGEYRAAHDFFATAINLRPTQVNAYYGLALTLEQAGDLAGARGAMRTYVHLAPPGDPFARKAKAALWEWGADGYKSAGSSSEATPDAAAKKAAGAKERHTTNGESASK